MKALARHATLLTLAAYTALAAAGPISLSGVGDDKQAHVVDTFNVYGSCGGAVVQIVGVDKAKWKPKENFFDFEESAASGVYVLAVGRTLKVETSDHNAVICRPVAGTKESRLIVGSNCAGSACGEAMNYKVLDPAKLAVISPAQCDEACARSFMQGKR